MDFNAQTPLRDIMEQYPDLKEKLIKREPRAKVIDTPLGRMMLKKATIGDVSAKTGVPADRLIQELKKLIEA